MIDNTRAKTGYDVELLLGNRYFLAITRAALATGKFPPFAFPGIKGKGPWTVELLDVTETRINDENPEIIEEENRIRDLSIWLTIRLTFNKQQEDGSIETSIRDTFIVMEVDLRVSSGQIHLDSKSWKMETDSRKRVNEIGQKEIDSLLAPSILFIFEQLAPDSMTGGIAPQNVRHVALKKMNATAECQPAIGLYFNLDLDLNDYYENDLARYIKERLPLCDLNRWTTGEEVLEFIDKHNHPKDVHGEPLLQPWPLNPQFEMDVAYQAERWHPDHLSILPEHRPLDSMGGILTPDDALGFTVQTWQHFPRTPMELLANGENSIYAHILGNRRFGSLEIDPNDYHPIVKDVDGVVLTEEEIYQLYLKNPLRGNLAAAENYLPEYADFMIGINPSVLGRFGKDVWNVMKAANPKKNPPLYDEKGAKVGKLNQLRLMWDTQRINMRSNLTYYIDNYPDASVDITTVMTPKITTENLIAWESTITHYDADTGILTDILGGLLFGLVGALGFFGGALCGVGLALAGAASGVGIAEAVESAVAASTKDRAKKILQSQAATVFNLLPAINGMFPRILTDEACYCEMHGVAHCFKEFNINASGMALGGWAQKGMYPVPLDCEIVGRTRVPVPDTDRETLFSLRYRNRHGVESDLRISESTARLEDDRLKKTKLTPEAVRRGRKKIDTIRFTSGVNLWPEEVIDLMDWGIIDVDGYTVVHMKNGTRYLRNVPDKEAGNNLSQMPAFKP